MRLVMLVLVFFFSVPAAAETFDTGEGATFDVPKGWKKGEAKKTSVALLKSASTKNAQIDVRVAPVKNNKSKQYFTTFHATLLNNGMKKEREGEMKVAGAEANETEYTVTKKGQSFRIVVIQFQKNDKAWLFVGMFPSKKRESLYKGMLKMIETVKLI